VVGADGSQTDIPRAPKEFLADVVWDLVAPRLRSKVALELAWIGVICGAPACLEVRTGTGSVIIGVLYAL
jgi:hypothetical protein